MFSVYPLRGTSYDELLQIHHTKSLKDRKNLQSARFLAKLLSNRIDCIDLLSYLRFDVPRTACRSDYSFNLPTPKTSILRLPIYQLPEDADRFYSDILQIL